MAARAVEVQVKSDSRVQSVLAPLLTDDRVHQLVVAALSRHAEAHDSREVVTRNDWLVRQHAELVVCDAVQAFVHAEFFICHRADTTPGAYFDSHLGFLIGKGRRSTVIEPSVGYLTTLGHN